MVQFVAAPVVLHCPALDKKRYAPPAYRFRSRSWLNPQPSEKVPFWQALDFYFKLGYAAAKMILDYFRARDTIGVRQIFCQSSDKDFHNANSRSD